MVLKFIQFTIYFVDCSSWNTTPNWISKIFKYFLKSVQKRIWKIKNFNHDNNSKDNSKNDSNNMDSMACTSCMDKDKDKHMK